jgi:hypothetical protein
VSPALLDHVFASSISLDGDKSCNLENGHFSGEICDSLRWVEISR